MLDQPSKPFDITKALGEALDAEVPAFKPGGIRYVKNLPLRWLADQGDSPQDAPPSEYAPSVDQPTGPADASEALLDQRQDTHGDFSDNARVSQAIKRILRGEPGWELLCDIEREALDMIALKISRILSGKSLERQHWEDVVGYGKLAEKQCPQSSS